jgi:myo-inositol-1(or 4)-monophosphatase
MTATDTALEADWLGVCRRAVSGLERVLRESPSTAERIVETGTRGSGGDRTLVIDRSAEEVVVAELQALRDGGVRFHVLSEERGEIDFGDPRIRVIVDPIDGSLNAKRDASHYALSIAVADGPTMADVAFAFVHDFGCGEQWWARRGEGAWRDSQFGPRGAVPLDPTLGERRDRDGKLELLGIESADPRWVRSSIDALAASAHRLRALGTIAVTLCQVAAARYDGMVTLRRCRGVDAAAGQLIVREAGGAVGFPDCAEPLGAPLDATPSSHLVAARTQSTLRELERIPA